MVDYRMYAEYGPGGRAAGVRSWHIVREEETVALCGRELEPGAETRDPRMWTADPDLTCHTCGALFLRQAPYLPSEHD